MSKIVEIEAIVEKEIVPYRDDSNWGMYGCTPSNYEDVVNKVVYLNKYNNITIRGNTPRLTVGEKYKIKAAEQFSKDWGYSYEIVKIYQDVPSSPEEQVEYIRSQVTELQFEAIYSVYSYDDDIVQMMKDDTFDYNNVRGIGSITYEFIKEKILKNLEMRVVIKELADYKLSFQQLFKLLKQFTSSELMIATVKENPYVLTRLHGYGFKKADEIALALGIPKNSKYRIRSAIMYQLQQNEMNGNTYIKYSSLLTESQKILSIKKNEIKDVLETMNSIIIVDDRVAITTTYVEEEYVAARLKDIDSFHKDMNSTLNYDVDVFISKQEKEKGITLTCQQKEFFRNFKYNGINLLIGYAGCGKTLLTKFMIALLEELGLTYTLLSPTGKAAKVFSKHALRKAFTIHKATGLGRREDDEQVYKEIKADVIIVDESSMCGIKTISHLLQCIPKDNVRIVFIGDSFQLPSVECGNFLYDLQESKAFATTILDIVWRQKEGGILDVVTRIRLGQKLVSSDFVGVKRFGKNCLFVSAPQEKMSKGFEHYFNQLMTEYSKDDIMALTPTKKGNLGTRKLNKIIQEIVNPLNDREQIKHRKDSEEAFFRVDDNVMNTSNAYKLRDYIKQYELDVMNGDTGRIKEISPEDNTIVIEFDEGTVMFNSSYFENIIHSGCITMHKSQGSSAKAVISICDKAHTHQLTANLLYVAGSRAEEMLIILCQAKTFNRALRKFENLNRNTFLKEMLHENTA
ncbi:AAA family ATPase [Paenibacillus alvei]|uniref:AAA family ATPase n=1 Tax=Paenibacillus alvei TaxID=44250 RepID=UPI00227F677B|nr:AAA family ATPase [Paenibacillus alvei]MCY9737420.1 AAA family ATPase [Paenibacillus alvei]